MEVFENWKFGVRICTTLLIYSRINSKNPLPCPSVSFRAGFKQWGQHEEEEELEYILRSMTYDNWACFKIL
jgi:hypothetical protein